MESILVTGGTGRLGRAVVRRLSQGGHQIRILSRRAGPADPDAGNRRMVGDLVTGQGLSAAVAGVQTIVHCATTNGRRDVTATQNLVDAARSAGRSPHLLYVSIVGIDEIPLPYYRSKLAAERVVAESGLGWTVQRTTQFHNLVAGFFGWQRRMPVTLTLKHFRFQPIDTRDVARRLAELVADGPAGRVPGLGGPDVASMSEFARTYHQVHQRRRRIVSIRVPGKIARGFAGGSNLVPQSGGGTISFADFVAEQAQEVAR